MKRFLYLLFLMHSLNAWSQRANNWVFGNLAWINFSTTPPSTALSGMLQLEGSSSISDLNGQLLFYSDGRTIWNAEHQPMPNGINLHGNFSSTQSSMIIPFPANPSKYYVFTMDVIGGGGGLSYSVVNMNLDNGKGDVESKNNNLIWPSTEKVTSVNHCNGTDVWVVTAALHTDRFYAYPVTATGIQLPVITSIGTGTNYFGIGYLKFSPDGRKLACANMNNGLDLFDFDAATGVISNRKTILPGPHSPYGIEFSPDSKNLYVSDVLRINNVGSRFDLSQYTDLDGTAADINASRYELDFVYWPSAPVGLAWFNALQLGPDERIHVSIFSNSQLRVISKPNRLGAACIYEPGIQLAPNTSCTYGLPDFNQSYFKVSFDYDASCVNNEVKFYFSRPFGTTSIEWDFGDPASWPSNSSTIDSPVHVYSKPGVYEVKLIVRNTCKNDTLKKQVSVGPIIANLGPDKVICGTTPVVLSPQITGIANSYLWQDNSTLPQLTASASGIYWVEIANTNGCIHRDSIELTFQQVPVVNLGKDTAICENTTLLLDAGNPGATFTWQDNSTGQTLSVHDAGTYSVEVNANGCTAKDTIAVDLKLLPRPYLGNDTAICMGMTIQLAPKQENPPGVTYLWNNGAVTPSLSVLQAGTYSLSATNECGNRSDTVIVKNGVCKLYVPTAFTPNSDGKNDVFKPGYGENVTRYTMDIYNRWGERIFSSNQLADGWNGRINGVLQPPGIFVWTIRYQVANDPVEFLLKGTVALIY